MLVWGVNELVTYFYFLDFSISNRRELTDYSMCACVTKTTNGNFDAKIFKCGVLLHFVIHGWLLHNVYDKNWVFNGIRHMCLFPVELSFCVIDVNQSFYLIMQQNESFVYSVLLKSLKSNQQTSLVSALSNIIILAKHLYNLCIYC